MLFEFPAAFALLLFAPLLIEFSSGRRLVPGDTRKKAVWFSSPVDTQSIPPSSRTTLRGPLLSFLLVGSYFFFVIALARPQLGTHFIETEASGRDILLVLDVSGSMRALDFFIDKERVDRLTALKSVVEEFIDGRRGDRMGLIVFAEQAYTQCPLTLDLEVVKEFVDSLEVGMAGNATGIGTALAVALKQLKSIESASKVVVLVTDGKNNIGSISPSEAAKIAERLKIKIHSIGIGGKGLAPFPQKTFFGGTHLVQKRMDFDEQTLIDVSKTTGGNYFNAKNTDGLRKVYQEIDKLEERKEKTFEHVEYEERYLLFAVIGLVLFIVYLCLDSTIFLRVP